MFEAAVEATIYQGDIKRRRGHRLPAIDGSKINLPNDPRLREYFGTIGAGNSSPCARGSILYDMENDLIVDARIEPMAADERTLATEHIRRLAGIPSFGKELILFGRGYPSMELIEQLTGEKIDFVMKVREKFDAGIDALGLGDHRVILEKGDCGPVEGRGEGNAYHQPHGQKILFWRVQGAVFQEAAGRDEI